MLRLSVLAFALVAGCYQSHSIGGAGDGGPGRCVVPPGGHCCCQGDVTQPPFCSGDDWSCPFGWGYHVGDECRPECGRPCTGCTPADAGVADVVMCAATPPVFPTFDRSCALASDCAIASHQTDCCGSFLHTGISAHETARFDRAENRCRMQYPECMCIGGESADDGTTPVSGPSVRVECLAGTCTTTFFVGG